MGSKLIAEFRVARNSRGRLSWFQRCKYSITLESHVYGQVMSAYSRWQLTRVIKWQQRDHNSRVELEYFRDHEVDLKDA